MAESTAPREQPLTGDTMPTSAADRAAIRAPDRAAIRAPDRAAIRAPGVQDTKQIPPNIALEAAMPPASPTIPWSGALKIILPLAALAVFLFFWNEIPIWLGLHEYEVPTFAQDMQALINQWGTIGPNLKVTIVDALVGFFVGNLLAIIGAILFSQSKYIEWTFFPLAILVQTIPIVVIAPIMVILFSVFGWGPFDPLPIVGIGSKPILAVTVLISFFPTLVNMAVGLRAVDPNLYDFMRLLNASRLTVLWRLRIPSSMPYLFSSFKITSTLCFVGAVVGEWMLANQTGIGGLINVFNYEEDKSGLWAAVIAVSLSSMVFFAFVVLAERVLLPWRQER